MAQYTTYMNYMIFFSEDADYAFATGLVSGNFIQMSPRAAAAMFGIPFPYPSGDMQTISKGISFLYPFSPGLQFFHPLATGIFVDDTVDSQLVPGQAGNPPSVWPTGPDCLFVWSGTIVKTNGDADISALPTTPIAQRRWIGGSEAASFMEGGTLTGTGYIHRGSSRVPGGFGKPIRGVDKNNPWTRSTAEYRTALQPPNSWERFYFRVQTAANSAVGVWRCHGNTSAAAGCGIKVLTGGTTFEVFDINAFNAETSKGTFTATLGVWHRIDILLKYATGGGTDGRIRILLDGVDALSYTVSAGSGMNSNVYHTTSDLGDWMSASTDTTLEMDLDDWICADLPGHIVASTLSDNPSVDPAVDWLMGSHVRGHFGISGTHTNWTGGKGVMINQQMSFLNALNANATLTSTTSGATMEALTDAVTLDTQDSLAAVFGAVAAIIGHRGTNSGATDGTLGYKKAGGAAVMTTIDQIVGASTATVSYLPSGMIVPDEISPWSILHNKSADANSDVTHAIYAVVEYIGVWGPEDDATYAIDLVRDFHHNCRFVNTVWGYFGPVSDAPVYAVGATYTGNGTYQEIDLPAPCHFLWIRGVGVGANGIRVFGAGLDAHWGTGQSTTPGIRIWTDFTTGACKFSVSGPSVEFNQNASTYQYIAFCDPGMRFSICGTFRHPTTGAASYVNPFPDEDFTPDAAFVSQNNNLAINTTDGIWFKGPGHAGSAGMTVGAGTALATFGTFAAGSYTSEGGVNKLGNSMDYMMFRHNEEFCAGIMVQTGSYTGDGSSPRDITLTPAGSRWPLLAVVIPEGGSAIMRDPSHTGSNSCSVAALANTITGIIGGGVDKITVQSSLNANGVKYHYFVICGNDTSWANGIYYNPNCQGVKGPEPEEPGGLNIIPEGGLILGDIVGGGTPIVLIRDPSGIYTLVPGKTNDTLLDRLPAVVEIDVEIPDPTFKTGYVGG